MPCDARRFALTAVPLSAVIGCVGTADTTLPEEEQIVPGAVEVFVSTSGPDPDPDGYLVLLDEALSETVDVNGSVTFSPLRPGRYQATLGDVAGNCTVQGSGATQSLTVVAGSTTNVTFTVVCA